MNLLTVAEAAIELRVSTDTIRRLLRTGKMRGLRVGGQWRVSEDSLPRPFSAEFCICAAIRMPDGEVVHGHRHDGCLTVVRNRMDALRGLLDDPPGSLEKKHEKMRSDIIAAEQGFVTSMGRFVDRKEAMEIQRHSGRPSKYSKDGSYRGEELFSEDLY